MRVTPEDIKTFSFCPYLFKERGSRGLYSSASVFVAAVRDSIRAAEVEAMRTKGFISTAIIGRYWNKIWWPAAAEAGLSAKETERKTLPAAMKFSSYCKYDIVGTGYFTLAVGVPLEKRLLDGVLHTEIDILKVPKKSDSYITAIDLRWEKLSRRKLSLDVRTMAIAYALSGLEKDVVYIYADLASKKDEVVVSSCYYNKSDIASAGRTIEFLMQGMKKKIDYRPYWTCKGCNKCRSSNF